MKDVFWMGIDFKAQLCLWAPPCPINAILIYKFRLNLNSQIISSITGIAVLTCTPLEWLVAMHITFDKNTGGKTLSDYLLQISFYLFQKLYKAWVLCASLLDSNCKENSNIQNFSYVSKNGLICCF